MRTRSAWQELRDLAADEPEQTLPEIVRLVDVELALENLTEIYDYLVAERAPP